MLKNVIIMMLGAVEPTSLHILVLMKDITYNDVEERQYHYDGIEQREERIMLSFIIT